MARRVGGARSVRLAQAVQVAAEKEGGQFFHCFLELFKLTPLLLAYELLIKHKQPTLSGDETKKTGGCTMNKTLVGVVPSAEFERARGCISELSNYSDYDDWLDSRYGRFMGLSMAGAEASLETVALEDFLSWCLERRLRPSEDALDDYAQLAWRQSRREPLSAVV